MTTTGRKTGRPRHKCVRVIQRGDRAYLVALRLSHIAVTSPTAVQAWVHNIRANPRVRFLGPGRATGNFVAREAQGDERGRLWDEAVDYYAGYATYKIRAGEREIPIVVLERA